MDEKKQYKSEKAVREEKILDFWRENKIFEKTLARKSVKGEFVFYEGPPGANGVPMLHHFEARAFKDVIPRYKTMQGYHVDRRAGWDCHGLPVELQAEKELGLASKKDIEVYGVARYNDYCRSAVLRYTKEWEIFTHRMGYWVDNDRAYYTMSNSFIESAWHVVKEAANRGYLYKDYKILPWCSRCGTGLSSHELGQPGAYVDVKDLSVYAKFPIVGFEKAYFVAWTTTPWTLPGNVALAVGADIDYVEAKVGEEILVVAKERLSVLGEGYEIIAEHKGKDMAGMKYTPLFNELENAKPDGIENAFKIYVADFVTTTDGTGIVHTAVMYGADDFELGTKVGLPKYHTVNPDGTFMRGLGNLSGRFVRDEDVAVDIIKDLAHRGLLFKKEKYEHSYPHCWRCKTPLIYYARDSWYFAMSKLRDEMSARNESIHWEPEYIKDGRFGEWLREAKDWAISRERYWGTPLPVWQGVGGELKVIGSIEEFKKYAVKSGNSYFIMRHGGTEGNEKNLVSYKNRASDHLTEKGKQQVLSEIGHFKKEGIDIIIASPFARTRETAEIVRTELGLAEDALLFDDRLAEINAGDFDGKNWNEYHKVIYDVGVDWYKNKIPNGESLQDVGKRIGSLLYEIEEKYKDKRILLVTHGGPAWLAYVVSGEYVPDGKTYHMPETMAFVKEFKRFTNAEIRKLNFVPIPHNTNYELDLHKPYVDEVKLVAENGEVMTRVKEVMDVWFDSGVMPFGQEHYPFENKEYVDTKGYPADFISEAIDQTRGWFYTLVAVSALLGKPAPFKNVICLGHLLDAKGQKMSKSKGNVIDPWGQMDKFGADAVRLWMYSVTQPGDSKNYDEKVVTEMSRQVFGLLSNVLAFYELYPAEMKNNKRPDATAVLNKWILARLDQYISLTTEYLDAYKIFEPARELRNFIDDLSTWYVRRSRDKIKAGDIESRTTLYFVLKTLAQVMAPFAPFTAEEVWQKLKINEDAESVHLSVWPTSDALQYDDMVGHNIMRDMQIAREVCTEGNAHQKKLGIPVRQPLSRFIVKNWDLSSEYATLVKEELNVKDIVAGDETVLDINITPELKLEGDYRELVRKVQDLRKEKGLIPSEAITLVLPETYREIMQTFGEDLKKTVGAKEVVNGENMLIY